MFLSGRIAVSSCLMSLLWLLIIQVIIAYVDPRILEEVHRKLEVLNMSLHACVCKFIIYRRHTNIYKICTQIQYFVTLPCFCCAAVVLSFLFYIPFHVFVTLLSDFSTSHSTDNAVLAQIYKC